MRHLVILSAGERISASRSDLQGYVLRFGSLSLFLNRDALNRLESALRGAEDQAAEVDEQASSAEVGYDLTTTD